MAEIRYSTLTSAGTATASPPRVARQKPSQPLIGNGARSRTGRFTTGPVCFRQSTGRDVEFIPESRASVKDGASTRGEKGSSAAKPSKSARCRRRLQQPLQHRTACSISGTCICQITGRSNRPAMDPEITRVRPRAVHSVHRDEYSLSRMRYLAIPDPWHRMHRSARYRVGQPGRTLQCRMWGTCRKTARP